MVALLEALLKHAGRIVTREELTETVLGRNRISTKVSQSLPTTGEGLLFWKNGALAKSIRFYL